MDVMVELAHRLGFQGDFLRLLNTHLNLKEPHTLDPSRKYTLTEIHDVWAKSWFGSDKGLAWFKEHGFVKIKRTVEERYPGPSLKVRAPIYFENFITTGRDIERVLQEIGIEDYGDLSSYRALPDWLPCPAYEEPPSAYDLYAVNYKIPIHFQHFTVENPWLAELGERHPSAFKVLINARVARERGIRDGDLIWVESRNDRVQGRAKLSEGIHPEVVGIAGKFGSWALGKPIARGKGVPWSKLLNVDLEHLEGLSGVLDRCIKVKVYKAQGRDG